jgi:glutaminyl-tRNA synthetase
VDAAGAAIAGSKVRLKYGLVVECTGVELGAAGQVQRVVARVIPDTRSGTPGADAIKVKGVITWVSQADAVPVELRLFDRLFTEAQPDAGGRDFLTVLNPESRRVSRGYLEPALADAAPGSHFQFERHGYFVADRLDHAPQRAVFNRVTGLKDSWSK